MRRFRELLKLTKEEREELTRVSQSRALPAGEVFRARLVLALASGKSYGQIETELQTSRPTIARWKQRFEVARLDGLEPRYQGTKPRTATPTVEAKVLRKTYEKPTDGSTHWSCRKLADVLGMSKSTVQRIWSEA